MVSIYFILNHDYLIQDKTDHEFYIECDNSTGSLSDAIKQLREESKYLHILAHSHRSLDQSGLWLKVLLF